VSPRAGAVTPEELERLLVEVGRAILEHGPAAAARFGAAVPEGAFDPASLRRVIDAGAARIGLRCPAPRLAGLASAIDHTLLRADATLAEIDRLCGEALEHRFASVCVNGTWARRCAEILRGSPVFVSAVVGFPLGASATEVKAYEARTACEDGACEIDMVQNVGALKSGLDELCLRDVAAVLETCREHGARLKVILETCLLGDEEKARACRIARAAGADYVKTSTGFAGGGATVADVRLMRSVVGPAMGIKAAGGVRDGRSAQDLLAAGATRIGASASVAIVGGKAAGGVY
jgi:deoxyribose-phosphate aldolase